MHANLSARPLLWDKVYDGIADTSVTAVTVPDDRWMLEGHDLAIVEVGQTTAMTRPSFTSRISISSSRAT
jgi:hypothetical protein